jgi:hypothetical protein
MELMNSYKAFCRVADSLITPHSDALLDLLVLPYHMRPVPIPSKPIVQPEKKTCLFEVGNDGEHLDVLDVTAS